MGAEGGKQSNRRQPIRLVIGYKQGRGNDALSGLPPAILSMLRAHRARSRRDGLCGLRCKREKYSFEISHRCTFPAGKSSAAYKNGRVRRIAAATDHRCRPLDTNTLICRSITQSPSRVHHHLMYCLLDFRVSSACCYPLGPGCRQLNRT